MLAIVNFPPKDGQYNLRLQHSAREFFWQVIWRCRYQPSVAWLLLLLMGSWIYCVLTCSRGARRYLAISPSALTAPPPISVP